jgi:hypothetical protein
MHNTVEKYFGISIAPVRSRGRSLVYNKFTNIHDNRIPPTTPVSGLVNVRPVVKIIAESLSQHDEKQDAPTPLSGVHTYHSRLIPEGVAEVSQIFLRDTHVLPKLVSYQEHCRRDRW